MKKTLRVEVCEVLEPGKKLDAEQVIASHIASTLVETDCGMFFLLDEENYRKFLGYFEFVMEDETISEIYTYFS